MSAEPVRVVREGPVVQVTLNRPERRNAIGGGMGEALDALLAELPRESGARVVVLRGAGGHFCAGLDLTEVAQGTEAERLAAGERRNRAMGERLRALSGLPQVVVAAVEGAAHAGGLGFVCAADIALAQTKALLAALGPVAPEAYAEAGVAAFARTASGAEAAEGLAAFRERRKPGWAS